MWVEYVVLKPLFIVVLMVNILHFRGFWKKYHHSFGAADFHKAVVTFKKLAVNKSRILCGSAEQLGL